MIRLFVLLLLGLLCVGCPGKKRPPPWAIAKLAQQEKEDQEAARRAAERAKPKPPPPSIDSLLKRYQAELKTLQGRAKTVAAGDKAALLADVKALETRGIALQKRLEGETTDEEDPRLDALLELLELVGDLRYALVESKPGK